MDIDSKLKTIYQEAYDFLKSKVDESVLRKQLEYYHLHKSSSIEDIFKQMVGSLKNKQGYVNFIAEVNQLEPILLNFNPNSVFEEYGLDWKKLFLNFKEKFGDKYKMDINNPRNAWVMYSKGVLSCAKFLSNFKSVKEFDDFVKLFFYNELTIASLPMLLEKEIFGFGFPLACDFLKELGYVQYGKPDVHLKDIFLALDLVETNSNYEVFKIIVKMGLLVGQDPVVVDKVFWLIGSGNFSGSDIKIGRQKEEFIGYIKSLSIEN